MKGIYLSLATASFVMLSSCIKDTLILPEKVSADEGKEIIDVIVKPSDVKIEGGYENLFTFKWPKFSDKVEKVKLSYREGDSPKEILISDFTKDFLLTTDKNGAYEFTLTSLSKQGKETVGVKYRASNKGLYVDDIINYVGSSVVDENIVVEWSNPLKRGIEASIIYTSANGIITEVVKSTQEKDKYAISGLYGTKVDLQLKDSLGNVATHSINYGMTTTSYTSASQKAGWSAVVSSNHVGDGGGAPALIDGAADTFWHSPWSGTILPWPHYATITLNREMNVSGFILLIRHNNGTAAPRDFDFQTSVDGKDFVTVQSFQNSSTTAGATLTFNLNNSVKTKYVRLLFKTSVRNLPYISLGEISLTENVLYIK